MTDWSGKSTAELLTAYVAIMRELRTRGLVRSTNNPVADLAEALAQRAFKLELAIGSTKGYDAKSADGKKWQIKGRRLTKENSNTGMGVIRNLDDMTFDFLLGIYFNEDFSIREAYRVEHAAVAEYADTSKAQGGRVLRVKEALKTDPRCLDVTTQIRDAMQTLQLEVSRPEV